MRETTPDPILLGSGILAQLKKRGFSIFILITQSISVTEINGSKCKAINNFTMSV